MARRTCSQTLADGSLLSVGHQLSDRFFLSFINWVKWVGLLISCPWCRIIDHQQYDPYGQNRWFVARKRQVNCTFEWPAD